MDSRLVATTCPNTPSLHFIRNMKVESNLKLLTKRIKLKTPKLKKNISYRNLREKHFRIAEKGFSEKYLTKPMKKFHVQNDGDSA